MDISTIKKLLLSAGVEVNGKHPWDVQIKDERTYARVLRDGSLGLGKAYMDGAIYFPRRTTPFNSTDWHFN